MRATRLALVALVAAAAALAGCDKARSVSADQPITSSCTSCHGGLDNTTGAPPRDTAGDTARTKPSVGAHTKHVDAGLDCDACHVKPGRVRDPGHLDGTVTITFGPLALLPTGSAPPSYDPVNHTCSNVYCHGSKLPPSAQGQATTPNWIASPLAGAPCGSCHGSAATFGAPTSQHPGGFTGPADCNVCHPSTVDTTGALIPAAQGGLHMNGQPDISATACSACHGDRAGTRGETAGSTAVYAPPVDTAGNTAGAKVGAHLRHVSTVLSLGSRLTQPFPCTECHVVPSSSGPHNPTSVVQFGTAAPPAQNVSTTGGLAPVYTPGTGSCASTYCHGGSLNAGGTNHSPTWNAPGTAACGTCHFQASTVASAAGHPQTDKLGQPFTSNGQCNQCHGATVDTGGNILVGLGNHVNGSVEATSPHAAGWVDPANHGPAAKRDLASCQPCHGTTFATDVGGGKSCNTCHANPVAFVPGYTGPTHPTWQTECTFCHGSTTRAAVIYQDPAYQGTFGAPGNNAARIAPYYDTEKNTAATAPAVGAHLRHMSDSATEGNRMSAPFTCDQCHGVGVLGNAAHQGVGHVDAQVAIGWQLAATGTTPAITPPLSGGAIPAARTKTGAARVPAAVTCANYCHGATIAGGAASKTVTWNAPGSVNCGDCHSLPPTYASPSWHTASANSANCATCHYAGVNKALHVNGKVDLAAGIACNSCHGSAANAAPPGAASSAASATTDARVGAHQAHVTAGALARPFDCDQCHTLPTAMNHANGTVTLTWSTLATARATTPTPDDVTPKTPGSTTSCTNYCHGGKWIPAGAANDPYRGNLTAPTWTAGSSQVVCGSCHQVPPTSSAHAAVTGDPTKNCGDCHGGYNCTTGNLAGCTVNKTAHVNGTVDANLTCTSCHGSATNVAPPVATSGSSSNTNPKVGAHQKHVTSATLRSGALQCADCHTVPTATNHSDSVVQLTWNTLAKVGGITPTPGNLSGAALATWESTPSCTNYCHGTFPGGRAATPLFTDVGPLGCNACHGQGAGATAQPPGPISATVKHPQTTSCPDCHAGYTASSVNLAVHIDGTRSFPTGCAACHGELTAPQPLPNTDPRAAPGYSATAKDSHGNTVTSARGVGAHNGHLTGLAFRGTPIACGECHKVPATGDVTHVLGTADVSFGTLAKTAWPGKPAITPVWNGAGGAVTLTCSSVYCHGAFGGGGNATPTWASPSVVVCGSCHGIPPAFQSDGTTPHTTSIACASCHGGTYTNTTVDPSLHINGTLDLAALSCNSCHGGAVNNAPPVGTDGSTAATSPKVGAHQKHVTSSTYRIGALQCADCHTVPTSTSHSNGLIEVAWNTLATASAVVPTPAAGTVPASWESTPTCTNYCHGGAWAADAQHRGNNTTPSWITTGMACDSCHRAPPTSSAHSSVTSSTNCGSCHSGYNCTSANLAACTVNKTLHMNGQLDASSTCVDCHAAAIGTRRAVVPEFANTWSHKRSASPSGTVTKYDCCVCHMEGDVATGNTNATYHQNGVINLRDPDTGGNIHSVTWGGTGAGGYVDSGTDLTFVSFVRNLSSNVLEPAITAMMINQCLKCHDTDGAASTLARVPGGTQYKPFNTTIGSTANYTGTGVTAGGTPGGVTDVSASFAVTNAAYHPVRGKQNNSYVSSARMNAPWNTITKTGGNTTSWGYLISCWDCHSAQGASGVQTRSVTAHGSPTTLRNVYWQANALNLCTSCHNVQAGSSTHGAGSAWQTTGNGTPGGIAKTSCYRCHGSLSADAKPTRPYSAQDVHGVDGFAPSAGAGDTMWPVGSASNVYKPYAFFRNAGPSSTWNSTISWRPASAPGLTAGSATCGSGSLGGSGCGNENHGPYTPGGVY